jgi:NAD+ dependent glucose-6-phosphate dehydrogenase
MKTRVLVTGSQGLLGRVLCRGLAREYDLFGLDIAPGTDARCRRIDITDHDALLAAMLELKPACVLHLAASVRALDDWDDNLRHNIIGTRNVYAAAAQAGVKRVIYASSNQVVKGHEAECPDGFTIAMSAEPRPTSYYAVSKLFGEAIARRHYERDGLESICLRIGTVTVDDMPRPDGRTHRTWLSHHDLVQIVDHSLRTDVRFGIYFAVSGNTARLHDLSSAQGELNYVPLDDGASTGRLARTVRRCRFGLRAIMKTRSR